MALDLRNFDSWLKLQGKSWRTRKAYLEVIRHWSLGLDGEPPTKKAAEEFLGQKVGSKKAASSLFVYLSALRSYFRWGGVPTSLNFSSDTVERLRKYHRENYLYMNNRPIRVSGKRPRPELCELCNRDSRRLVYHHWDDENYSKGLWLCWRCHNVAEAADVGILSDRYLELKQVVDKEAKRTDTGGLHDRLLQLKSRLNGDY